MKRIIAIALSIFIIASVTAVFTACGKKTDNTKTTVSTTENSAELTAEVGETSLKVFKGDTMIEEVMYPKDTDGNFNIDYAKSHIEFVDMNFDGNKDICLAKCVTPYSVLYYCWLYDAATGKFVFSEDLSKLTTISIDKEDKQVISLVHVSAAESYYVCYEWVDGKLKEVKKIPVDDKEMPTSVSNAVNNNTLGTKVSVDTTTRPSENKATTSTTKKGGTSSTTKKSDTNTTTKKNGLGVQIETDSKANEWF